MKPESIKRLDEQKLATWKEEMEIVPNWYKQRAYVAALSMLLLGILLGAWLMFIIDKS